MRTFVALLALLALFAAPAAAHHKPGHAGGPPDHAGPPDGMVEKKKGGPPDIPGAPSGRFVAGVIALGDDCSDLIAVPEDHELTLRGGPKRVYVAPEDLVVEAFGDFAHVCLWDPEWIAEHDLRFLYHFTRIDDEDEPEPED